MTKNLYQGITEKILKSLEKGTIPRQPLWGGEQQMPKNLISGKAYQGKNAFRLSRAGYESPYWLTARQSEKLGGHIRDGERGMDCLYWNGVGLNDTRSTFPFQKRYKIFNVAQCENVPFPPIEYARPHTPIEACEKVIEGMPNLPKVFHGYRDAGYSAYADLIQMPFRESFYQPEFYYGSLFHELVHSTGHVSRLGRDEIVNRYGYWSIPYCREELVGEMGSAFLAGYSGIETQTLDHSAAYIHSLAARLEGDGDLVLAAGVQAQKAADYILNKKSAYFP